MIVKSTLFTVLVVFCFACGEKIDSNHTTRVTSKDSTSNEDSATLENLGLKQVDFLPFRRAYHGHDNLSGSEREAFMHRNPELCFVSPDAENPFLEHMIAHGFVVGETLVLSKFDSLPEPQTFHYSSSKTLQLKIEPELITPGLDFVRYPILFLDEQDTVAMDTLSFDAPFVQFATLDLNRDGKDELISLYNWYIINGDNYDITVYSLDPSE